jgi:hypothetical protein
VNDLDIDHGEQLDCPGIVNMHEAQSLKELSKKNKFIAVRMLRLMW